MISIFKPPQSDSPGNVPADRIALRALVRRAAWPLAIKSLPAFYGAGLVLFVIRILPPGEFGRYGVAFAYINLLAVLTRGLWAVPLITWAARKEEDRVLGPVFWLSLGTAGLAALGAFLVLPAVNVSGYAPLLAASMLLVLIPRELGYALAQAHGRYRISFALEALYFLGSLIAFVGLYFAGVLRDAETALSVNLACAGASSIFAVVVFPRLLRPPFSGDWAGVWRFGRWISLLGLSEVYLQQGDALLIGAFMTPAHIAPYLAARTILRIYALFSQTINFVVLPVASRLAAAGQLDRLRGRLAATFRALFMILIPVNAVLWYWAPAIFPLLLGEHYAAAVPFFRVLVFATFVEPVYIILGNAIVGIGRPAAVAGAIPAAMVLNVVGLMIMVPWLGLPAAPYVLVATYTILAVQLIAVSRRHLSPVLQD